MWRAALGRRQPILADRETSPCRGDIYQQIYMMLFVPDRVGVTRGAPGCRTWHCCVGSRENGRLGDNENCGFEVCMVKDRLEPEGSPRKIFNARFRVTE